MKTLVLLLMILVSVLSSYAQTDEFSLTYQMGRMQSSFFKETLYPIAKIQKGILTYTIEKNTSIDTIKFFRNTIDTFWNKEEQNISIKLNRSIIDSIYGLVKNIKDTLVTGFGGSFASVIHVLIISDKSFKLRYELEKACDTTAVKITNILNTFLPRSNQIWLSKYDVDETQFRISLLEKEVALKEKELKSKKEELKLKKKERRSKTK
jgi:hypothetical protein